MELLIIVVIAFALLYVINRALDGNSNKKKVKSYHYKRKDFIMSKAEYNFFEVLNQVLDENYFLAVQVHLSKVLDHKINGQNWRAALAHINQKSVDFVICDKKYLRPLLAIELDDKSHESEVRQHRDIEVERMLEEAGLPLLRIKNQRNWNNAAIHKIIFEKLIA